MKSSEVVSIFCVEGDTEEEFFRMVLTAYANGIPKTIINLHGIHNINKRVLGQIEAFTHRHQKSFARVYCCVDRESRDHNPPIDLSLIRENISKQSFKKQVLSVDSIIATQMIESWFFYDIDGIYKFLKTKKSERNIKKFSPPEKFTHIDLSRLFSRYEKTYIKGTRCRNFIENLDVAKIIRSCTDLKAGLDLFTQKHRSKKWELE